MKKNIKRVCACFIACTALGLGSGCDVIGKKLSTSGDATQVRCAPCTPREIWQWNEACYQEFFPLHRIAVYASNVIKCTVNGKDLSLTEQIEQDLSPGIYKIRFYTLENTILYKQTMEPYLGIYVTVQEEIPFEGDITLWVTISTLYEDVCDVNYRQENGLWVDASALEWYDECKAEWW